MHFHFFTLLHDQLECPRQIAENSVRITLHDFISGREIRCMCNFSASYHCSRSVVSAGLLYYSGSILRTDLFRYKCTLRDERAVRKSFICAVNL